MYNVSSAVDALIPTEVWAKNNSVAVVRLAITWCTVVRLDAFALLPIAANTTCDTFNYRPTVGATCVEPSLPYGTLTK